LAGADADEVDAFRGVSGNSQQDKKGGSTLKYLHGGSFLNGGDPKRFRQ
jgi:hypothetical protein